MPERYEHATAIPHAAALALGETLATVIASGRIDDEVIQTLHDVTLEAVRGLRLNEATGDMRRYLIEAIMRGGRNTPSRVHLRHLKDRFVRLDSYDRFEMSDYSDALNTHLSALPPTRPRRASY